MRLIYEEEEKKTGIIIVGFVLALVTIYGVIILPLQKHKLFKRGKYTIAVIKDIRYRKGANDPIFQFSYYDKTYENTESRIIQGTYSFQANQIGKRYFVLFDTVDPDNCCLLPENPVPDSFLTSPVQGWSSLP